MTTLTPNIKNVTNTLGYTTLIDSNILKNYFSVTNKLIKWGK